jgi:hypothetical protein
MNFGIPAEENSKAVYVVPILFSKPKNGKSKLK